MNIRPLKWYMKTVECRKAMYRSKQRRFCEMRPWVIWYRDWNLRGAWRYL